MHDKYYADWLITIFCKLGMPLNYQQLGCVVLFVFVWYVLLSSNAVLVGTWHCIICTGWYGDQLSREYCVLLSESLALNTGKET